jgi:hypothetical protein
MRTTLPGSVEFAYLSDRVVDSYLKYMTPLFDLDWQTLLRRPSKTNTRMNGLLCRFLGIPPWGRAYLR